MREHLDKGLALLKLRLFLEWWSFSLHVDAVSWALCPEVFHMLHSDCDVALLELSIEPRA